MQITRLKKTIEDCTYNDFPCNKNSRVAGLLELPNHDLISLTAAPITRSSWSPTKIAEPSTTGKHLNFLPSVSMNSKGTSEKTKLLRVVKFYF